MAGNDSYTKLLLHSDTTDGDVNFPDSSGSAHTVTVHGNVHHETDQNKFGKTAIHFGGTGDFLTVANHADFDPGSSDFTIDKQFYFTTFSTIQVLFTKRATSANFAPYIIFVDTSGVVQVLLSTDGTTWGVNFSGSALSLNTWTHIELVRDGGTIRLFVAGAADGTGAISGALMTNTAAFSIGANADGTYPLNNAYVDEPCFSNGIARYTAAFTPPVGPYTIPFSSWSQTQKIKLTIPARPSVLVNFPVRANFSATSGTSPFDCADVFDKLTPTTVDDDFTGTNGDAPDTRLWSLDSLDNGTAEINSNKLRMAVSSAITDDNVVSKYKLSGNFDIQVDFNVAAGPATSIWLGRLVAGTSKTVNSTFFCIDKRYNAVHRYVSGIYTGGVADDTDAYDVAETSGKFRLARSGTTVTCYRWNGSSWVAMSTYASWSTDDIYIKFQLYTSAAISATVDFDNFTKTTGTVVWDTPKKIAFEDVDSGEECYCEIERWDAANKKAQLWVKAPSLSATAVTVLNLYYDSARDDNTGYIGDIGSIQGQNVWDSNFVFVSHQAQDPSGTAPQIKDSTGYAKHGTSYGSMTSADLVDGLIGKGLDYDGAGDYTNHGYDVAHDITDTFTLEVTMLPSITLDSGLSTYPGLISRASDPTDYQDTYSLYFNVDGRLRLNTGGSGYIESGKSSWAADTAFCIVGTYKATGLEGDFFVDGAKETLNADSYDTMAGCNNNLVVGKLHDTACFFPGIIDEVRISNIVRSDDWITATNLSNTDALIAFSLYSTGNTTVLAILEQTYDLKTIMVLRVMEQMYSLSSVVRRHLEQVYSMRMLALLSQPYGDAPVVLKQLLQYYGSAAKVTQVLIQLYDDMHMIRTSLEQPYSYPAFLRKVMEQKYSVAGTQLLAMSNQLYSIQGTDLVRQQLLQPFSIASGESQLLTYTTSVVASGAGGEFDLRYYHINIEASRDQYCMSCEVHLAGQDDYMRCRVLDDLTITIDGEVFEFFVESKQRNRGHGTAEYTIKGLSKTGLLDAPYADPITDDLSGMASQIVAGLAAVYTVNWNTVDWHIPANTLMPADQTPLEIIRDIGAAAGAILQTEPDGSLTVEPAYPVPVNQWPTTAIDHHLSDALDFFTTGENYDHRPGYNRYLVSDQLTSDDTLRLEEEAITSATKYIRVYQTPWADDFALRHTGGDWVSLEPLEIEQPFIEDEIVEFVGGTGSTAYPIYARVAVQWLQTNLGTVTFAEDGTLQSSVAGESLLKISYRTKCRKYLATDHEDEQVQLVAEGVD